MRMKSKFMGYCKACGKIYCKNDTIEWTKEKGAIHPECLVFTPEEVMAAEVKNYRVTPEIAFLGEIDGLYHFRMELRCMTLWFSSNKNGTRHETYNRVKRDQPLYDLPSED